MSRFLPDLSYNNDKTALKMYAGFGMMKKSFYVNTLRNKGKVTV